MGIPAPQVISDGGSLNIVQLFVYRNKPLLSDFPHVASTRAGRKEAEGRPEKRRPFCCSQVG